MGNCGSELLRSCECQSHKGLSSPTLNRHILSNLTNNFRSLTSSLSISPAHTDNTMAPITLSTKHQDLLKAYIEVSKSEVSRFTSQKIWNPTDHQAETRLDCNREQSRLCYRQVCPRLLDHREEQASRHPQRGSHRPFRAPGRSHQSRRRDHESHCTFEQVSPPNVIF